MIFVPNHDIIDLSKERRDMKRLRDYSFIEIENIKRNEIERFSISDIQELIEMMKNSENFEYSYFEKKFSENSLDEFDIIRIYQFNRNYSDKYMNSLRRFLKIHYID